MRLAVTRQAYAGDASKPMGQVLPRAQRLLHRPSLKRLFPQTVRMDKSLRDAAIHKACLEFGYAMAATAREAGVHYSTVSKIIKGER